MEDAFWHLNLNLWTTLCLWLARLIGLGVPRTCLNFISLPIFLKITLLTVGISTLHLCRASKIIPTWSHLPRLKNVAGFDEISSGQKSSQD